MSLFNKNRDLSQASQRYSIKKFKFGAASVLVGLSFLGYGAQTVLAETPAPVSTTDTAATSEASAATSESPAATSEASAATSVAPAATSEASAATSEAPAATSEASAATSESPAADTTATDTATSESPAADTTVAGGAELRAAATTSNVDSVPADGQTFASDALPTAEQLIANAAELQAAGATIAYKEAPAVGKGYAVVTVTYADGSVREVTVLTTVNDTTKQELVQDAVPSGTEQDDAQSTVNGYVTYNRSGNPNDLDEDNAPRMEGVTVYAQWFERDGSASPVYSAVTGADGSYHIIMKPFIKADGSTAQFDADALLPEGEKFRIWAQNPDPAK